MKKKILSSVLATFCLSTIVFAYNPPAGGDQMEKLSSAISLTSASSSAGSGIFYAEPHSIQYNPALTAFEQRIALNAGFSILASTSNKGAGGAFQFGMLYPWKWLVGTAEVRGVFAQTGAMNVGNSIDATIGASKDITDRLSVGANIYAGGFWGASGDWKLGAGLGFLYRIPQAGFLKDTRIAASILNLGKNFTETTLIGIDNVSRADMFPGIATLRVGFATLFYQNDFFEIGGSLDLALPAFQNFLIDIGVQMSFGNFYVSIAEHINTREAITGHNDFIPSVSLGYRFILNTHKSEYMTSRGWQESEMRVDAGWKYMYSDMNAFAGSVNLKLGLKDTEAPEVELWGGQQQ